MLVFVVMFVIVVRDDGDGVLGLFSGWNGVYRATGAEIGRR